MAMVDHSAVLASATDGQQVSCRRQQTRRNRDREDVDARPEPLIDFGSGVADVREEDPGPLHVLKIKREIRSRDRLKNLVRNPDGDRLIATEIGAQAAALAVQNFGGAKLARLGWIGRELSMRRIAVQS